MVEYINNLLNKNSLFIKYINNSFNENSLFFKYVNNSLNENNPSVEYINDSLNENNSFVEYVILWMKIVFLLNAQICLIEFCNIWSNINDSNKHYQDAGRSNFNICKTNLFFLIGHPKLRRLQK